MDLANKEGSSVKVPKILVTGGCGFLGSHVCELFIKKGWRVDAFDNMSKFELMRTGYNVDKARDYNRNFLESIGVQIQKADVRDIYALTECAHSCDYIVHTAAQPAMTVALENPIFDFENNALGTLNVLETGRLLHLPVALCSTIHVYGNGRNNQLCELPTQLMPKRQDSFALKETAKILTGKITPLHVSKHINELYARAYQESYNAKSAVFRLTGFYGPRQLGGEDHGWVANFAIRTACELPIKIFGTDKQVRDILYVTDVAKAFELWHDNGCVSGLYNICGGVSYNTSLKDCLRILAQITGKTQSIEMLPARTGDLWYFSGNHDKATKTFKWQPTITPERGIQELVAWIQENKELFS